MEVHGTVHGTSTVHLPAYVKNHGILSGRDLQFLLRETKVWINKIISARLEYGQYSRVLVLSRFGFEFIAFVYAWNGSVKAALHLHGVTFRTLWLVSGVEVNHKRGSAALLFLRSLTAFFFFFFFNHLGLFPRSELDFNFPVVSTSCKLLERVRLLHLHAERVNVSSESLD